MRDHPVADKWKKIRQGLHRERNQDLRYHRVKYSHYPVLYTLPTFEIGQFLTIFPIISQFYFIEQLCELIENLLKNQHYRDTKISLFIYFILKINSIYNFSFRFNKKNIIQKKTELIYSKVSKKE